MQSSCCLIRYFFDDCFGINDVTIYENIEFQRKNRNGTFTLHNNPDEPWASRFTL
jgi:hypothetical protein